MPTDNDDFIQKHRSKKLGRAKDRKNTRNINIEGVKCRDETPNNSADQSKEVRSKQDGRAERRGC